MISACVVPTVKHGGGVMVWGFFAGDTVSDFFRIQGTLKPAWLPQHSAAIRHPIWFALSGTITLFFTSICFSPSGCVSAI